MRAMTSPDPKGSVESGDPSPINGNIPLDGGKKSAFRQAEIEAHATGRNCCIETEFQKNLRIFFLDHKRSLDRIVRDQELIALQMYQMHKKQRQLIRRDRLANMPKLYGKAKEEAHSLKQTLGGSTEILLRKKATNNEEKEHNKSFHEQEQAAEEVETDPQLEDSVKEDILAGNIRQWLESIVQTPVTLELEKPDIVLPPVTARHIYIPQPKKDTFSAQLIREKQRKIALNPSIQKETPNAYKWIGLRGAIPAPLKGLGRSKTSTRCLPGSLGAISERVITTVPLPRPVLSIYPAPNSMALYQRRKQLDCEQAVLNCWLKRGSQFSNKISLYIENSSIPRKHYNPQPKSFTSRVTKL